MTSLLITIPIPDPRLAHNGRIHWRQRAKLVKAARASAQARAIAALAGSPPPMWDKARLNVTAYFPTARGVDPMNLLDRLKAPIDGICDARVIVDDANLWPERPVIGKDAKNPRIELLITPEP